MNEERRINIISGIISIIICMVLLVLVYNIFLKIRNKDDVTVETIYIRSLYYQRNLKADFILGCGYLDGLDYFPKINC